MHRVTNLVDNQQNFGTLTLNIESNSFNQKFKAPLLQWPSSIFSGNPIYDCRITKTDNTNNTYGLFRAKKDITNYFNYAFYQSILLQYNLILPIPLYLVGPNNYVTTNQNFVSASFDSNDNPTNIILTFSKYTPINDEENSPNYFKPIIITVYQNNYTNNTSIFTQNSLQLTILYFLNDSP